MNKTKLLIGAGTFILAIGSFFAGNATKKLFNLVPNLYYIKPSTGVCTQISNSSVFTTGGAGTNITFRTNGGTVSVYTSNVGGTCTNAVNVKLVH